MVGVLHTRVGERRKGQIRSDSPTKRTGDMSETLLVEYDLFLACLIS